MSAAKEQRKKEYASRKADGAHDVGKSLEHSEEVGKFHNGRPLPKETIMKDSKIITSSGRLAKRNNVSRN